MTDLEKIKIVEHRLNQITDLAKFCANDLVKLAIENSALKNKLNRLEAKEEIKKDLSSDGGEIEVNFEKKTNSISFFKDTESSLDVTIADWRGVKTCVNLNFDDILILFNFLDGFIGGGMKK